MVYNKAKWIAAFQKAVVDLKMQNSPTSGKPCAIAALRYVRDGLIDDIGENKDEEAGFAIASIKDGCNELIKALSAGKVEDGFLSNASAAAKAAGYKPVAGVAGTGVDE